MRFILACGLLLALITTTAVASAASGRGRPSSKATPQPAATHRLSPTATAVPTATLPTEPPAPESVYFIASSADTGATLNALDPASGSARWPQPPTVAADAQIAVGKNTVFVLTPGTSLTALKATDGLPFWSQPVKDEFIAPPSLALDAAHDTLYALTQNSPTAHVMLHAYRARDGFSLWPQPYDTGATTTVALTAVDGNIFVNTGQALIVLDGKSGDMGLNVHLPRGIPATVSPVVAGNGVYLNSAGHVYAFDVHSGAQEWQQGAATAGGSNTLAVDTGDGLVFAAAGKTLETFQIANKGAPSQPVNESQPILGIAFANGFVYLSLDGGTMVGVPEPSQTGQTPPWSKSLGGSLLPPQVGSDGTVYTVAVSGEAPQVTSTIYALDPHNGTPERHFPLNGDSVVQFVVA